MNTCRVIDPTVSSRRGNLFCEINWNRDFFCWVLAGKRNKIFFLDNEIFCMPFFEGLLQDNIHLSNIKLFFLNQLCGLASVFLLASQYPRSWYLESEDSLRVTTVENVCPTQFISLYTATSLLKYQRTQ